MTISRNASNVRSRMRQGVPGDLLWVDALHDEHESVFNSGGQASQVTNMQVTTATAGADYVFTFNEVEYTATADGASATAALVAQDIVDFCNQEPLIRGVVTATRSTDTVVLTANWPGADGAFTLTESDAKLGTPSTITSASDSSDIEAGRVICNVGAVVTNFDAEDSDGAEGLLCQSAAFTAQVDTITPSAYEANTNLVVTIDIPGWLRITVSEEMTVDLTTSLTNLATAINLQLPANSVLAANSGGTALTLTAEVAGLHFDTTYGIEKASTATLSFASTQSKRTSVNLSFLGITRRTMDMVKDSSGNPVWEGNEMMLTRTKGGIWIEKDSGESPSYGDASYVEMSSGAEAGRLYTTKTATRLPLPAVSYYTDARSGSGDLIAGVVIA